MRSGGRESRWKILQDRSSGRRRVGRSPRRSSSGRSHRRVRRRHFWL
ncbi:hypothetical protein Rrhod_0455 [Rhodococcus rhodnii LMG 5362]|uniref:Uncharacterized protein n=1 Tax=Rhodococcus rhodnii LMG 5362 TaxID=1273125 RepID=R7WS57_9NOCA|nr:hypothetical protein Rrhod_0455 [Rhodococcus rhodnii LMG 5362]